MSDFGDYDREFDIWITKSGWKYTCRKTDRIGFDPYLAIVESFSLPKLNSSGLFKTKEDGLAWCREYIAKNRFNLKE